MDRRALIIGYLLVAAGSTLFASKAIFIKLAYMERYDALLILAWRMVFALPVFVVVGAIEITRRKAEGKPMPRQGAVLGAIAWRCSSNSIMRDTRRR
jgi:drug/metabolite transporter (DMT)-like permease